MKTNTSPIVLAAALLAFSPVLHAQSITVDSINYLYTPTGHTYRFYEVEGVNGTNGLAVCVDGNAAAPEGLIFNLTPLNELDVLSFHDHLATEGGSPITLEQREMAMWRANYFVENYWADYGLSSDYRLQNIARNVLSEIFMDATNPLSGAISSPASQTPDNRNVIYDASASPAYADLPLYNTILEDIINDINTNVTGSYISTSYYIVGLDSPATTDQSLLYVSPIPEPSSALLVGLSGSLVFIRRRRNA